MRINPFSTTPKVLNPQQNRQSCFVKYKKPTAKRLKNLKVKSFKIKGSNLRRSDFFNV